MKRLRVIIHGAVQGVGFRPFLHRLASELKLTGWVSNSAQGVLTEVEGASLRLRDFLLRIQADAPSRSIIQGLESFWLPAQGFQGFEIRASENRGTRTALVLPDIATCRECVAETFESGNRRFAYPFTNCTQCGPRFSIIEATPYDRARTSMRRFTLCAECQAEYDHAQDRRYHAQPNACPTCGPQLELWDRTGQRMCERDPALRRAATALNEGRIVAVKGLGGYHLMVRASDEDAVRRLRRRKHRQAKPFALMFPNLQSARVCCEVGSLEQRLLESPEAPIVLLSRKKPLANVIAGSVAPGCSRLGLMLPSTALHHLLLAEVDGAVVATSGNRGEDPICFDDQEAVDRLGAIADLFLTHNRPIVRPVDDSIVTVLLGREMILRRARGYTPLPFKPWPDSEEKGAVILGMGGHLKSCIALSRGPEVFLSQHLGDLGNAVARQRLQGTVEDLGSLLQIQPDTIAVDAHPDYASSRLADAYFSPSVRRIRVQHHYAHALACMADNQLDPPALAVVWDGAGYGLDGTIWGGEFLRVEEQSFTRLGHWRTFRLPGSEVASREPRRAALGMLWQMLGRSTVNQTDLPTLRAFTNSELTVLSQMLNRGLQAPITSSAGRLFDAVASLLDVRQICRFEGQAAMELEDLAAEAPDCSESYPVAFQAGVLDWEPLLVGLLCDLRDGQPRAQMCAKFHNSLIEAIATVAGHVGLKSVLLTGGCFQNRILLECAVLRLGQEGFRPYWHQRVPPNDGGIALGQIAAARQSN